VSRGGTVPFTENAYHVFDRFNRFSKILTGNAKY